MQSPYYARTRSGNVRHIISPVNGHVVLCSHRLYADVRDVSIRQGETFLNPEVWDLKPCTRCEKLAAQAGMTPPAAPPAEPTCIPTEDAFVRVATTSGGKVHSARPTPDGALIPLCRHDRGQRHQSVWVEVARDLTCARCIEYRQNRQRAREAAHTQAPGPALTIPDPVWVVEVAKGRSLHGHHGLHDVIAIRPEDATEALVWHTAPHTPDLDPTMAVTRLGWEVTGPLVESDGALTYDPTTEVHTGRVVPVTHAERVRAMAAALMSKDTALPVVDATTPAPEIVYAHGSGWLIDGALYPTLPAAVTALTGHPGYTGLNPETELPTLQAETLSASLPDGIELCGDAAIGWSFLCGVGSCSLADEQMTMVEAPTTAYDAAVRHVVHHMDPQGNLTLCGKVFVSGTTCRKTAGHTLACSPRPTEPAPSEGRVVTHQGHARGIAPEHADNPAARAAADILEAAGLPLATLTEAYDPETCRATGYMCEPRGGAEGELGEMVYTYYLDNGQITDPNGNPRRDRLREALRVLRAAGWAVDPQVFTCVRAHQVFEEPVPQLDHSVAQEIVARVDGRAEAVARAALTASESPALDVIYTLCQGWTVNGSETLGYRAARDVLVGQHGLAHTVACEVLDRAHIVVLNQNLPERLVVAFDDRYGGFMYECMSGDCQRSGGHDSPGGAAMFAEMHRDSEHCTYRPDADPTRTITTEADTVAALSAKHGFPDDAATRAALGRLVRSGDLHS